MEESDRSLLDRYLSGSDEKAFGQIVARHVDSVHAVAFRVTCNHELARDVTQTVFIRLARRAAFIPRDLGPGTWLLRVTRSLAIDSVRAESRRRKREIAAPFIPSAMNDSDLEDHWAALAPVIDELVERLPAADRDLLLLRYYRNQSHAVIAANLGLSESTIRQRSHRAVEKLRVLLDRRGITTSSVALATLMPVHAAPAAPAVLSNSILQAASGITPLVPGFPTATLLAVTTSQKLAFAGAFLMLVAATAYSLSPDPSAAAAAALARQAPLAPESSAASPPEERARPERGTSDTPEESLERLKAVMAIGDSSERFEALTAYLHTLSPGRFEAAAKYLEEVRYGEDLDAIELTGSAWAKADLPAALEFIKSGNGFILMDAVLEDWSTVDPHAAMNWALTQAPDPTAGANAVLLGAARANPEEVGKLVAGLPPGEGRSEAFSMLVPKLEQDPKMMREVLKGASESQRAVIYGSLAEDMADHAEGLRILKEHPEAMPFASVGFLFHRWAGSDPVAAFAAMRDLPPGVLRDEGLHGLIAGAWNQGPAAALAMMDRFPGMITDSHVEKFISRDNDGDPGLVLGEAHRIADEEKRSTVVLARLKDWIGKDPAAARAWIESHPQPPSIAEQLPTAE